MSVTFTGEIHPYAAVFPMLVEDDLDALAEDIKANGLQSPIVLDDDGVLVDGRNRLAACERAGVIPTFTVLDGDPVTFIVSANLQRRDLTAGMKAYYAVAAFQLETLSMREAAKVSGCSAADIAKAAVVARYAPDHFAAVLAGDMKPAIAYERATGIKADLDQAEKRRAELTEHAPDLLDKGLTLDEAYAAYQKRHEDRLKAEKDQTDWRKKLRDDLLYAIGGITTAAHVKNLADTLAGITADPHARLTPDDINHAATQLKTIATALKGTKR